MNRFELYETFVQRFARPESVRSVTLDKMVELEKALRIQWPRAYLDFYFQYGPITCRDTLHDLVAHELALWDIRSLLTETELLEANRLYANTGLRSSLMGFASDTMGNLFCFDRADLAARHDDAPVWFFDHEFCLDSQLMASFEEWIATYVALPFSPQSA